MPHKRKCHICGGRMHKTKGGWQHCNDFECCGSVTPEGEDYTRPFSAADIGRKKERLAEV